MKTRTPSNRKKKMSRVLIPQHKTNITIGDSRHDPPFPIPGTPFLPRPHPLPLIPPPPFRFQPSPTQPNPLQPPQHTMSVGARIHPTPPANRRLWCARSSGGPGRTAVANPHSSDTDRSARRPRQRRAEVPPAGAALRGHFRGPGLLTGGLLRPLAVSESRLVRDSDVRTAAQARFKSAEARGAALGAKCWLPELEPGLCLPASCWIRKGARGVIRWNRPTIMSETRLGTPNPVQQNCARVPSRAKMVSGTDV
jgi:hypothetical protein